MDVQEELKKVGTKFVTITFLTKTLEERKVNGLLKPLSKIKGTGKAPTGFVPIWSPRTGWACFKLEHVIAINGKEIQ